MSTTLLAQGIGGSDLRAAGAFVGGRRAAYFINVAFMALFVFVLGG